VLRQFIRAAVLLPALVCTVLAADAVNIWLDVPFVKQQKDGCGAATIAMVMQYWQQHQGLPANADTAYDRIESKLYSPRAHGIYASDMERYFRENGYRVFAFAGQWSDLARQLKEGRPLIAALRPTASKELHYVVVVGLDQPERVVLVNDPEQRKLLKENQSTFVRDWKATGKWTLLAVPETPAK
jgi:ABC-type bacteriocin/lantibiotic exporter with double-glycine peptidase domain